jgi:hypothetical protein
MALLLNQVMIFRPESQSWAFNWVAEFQSWVVTAPVTGSIARARSSPLQLPLVNRAWKRCVCVLSEREFTATEDDAPVRPPMSVM